MPPTAGAPAAPKPPQRILIIKPSSLGDVVHALPVLAGLRQAYPTAHIAWIVGTSFAPLLHGHPLLDEVIPFDRARFGRLWRDPLACIAFWRFVAEVRRRRFDLILDLQGLIRSGLLASFSGARRRIGFSDAREGAWLCYTQRVDAGSGEIHAVEKNLRLLAALGLPARAAEFPLPIGAAEAHAARRLLTDAGLPNDRGFVAVMPGARWKSKLWPVERFAALIDAIHTEHGLRCVLLGSPAERALAETMCAASRCGPCDLVGRTTLRELAALLARAQVAVSSDSGPMHIAAALRTPVVALFGPTSAQRTGPYSPLARIAVHRVPCAPCLRRTCPLGHHECLRGLSVAQVLAEVRESLRARDVQRSAATFLEH